jgi:hypothetical protein
VCFRQSGLVSGNCRLPFALSAARRTASFPFADDLELHTLELPKFRKAAAELTNGLDIWLYFLRHAEKMDPEDLPKPRDRPLIRRAVEELRMLTQADPEIGPRPRPVTKKTVAPISAIIPFTDAPQMRKQ